jgi:preprotein translocase subunit SecG
MNWATGIVLVVVLALVVLAIVAMRKGKGGGCHGMNGKCASCTADCPLKGKTTTLSRENCPRS